ncbi:hypothetical protein HQ560_02575, partial [bacterium]|nr:hypothetical protein [bacterium]
MRPGWAIACAILLTGCNSVSKSHWSPKAPGAPDPREVVAPAKPTRPAPKAPPPKPAPPKPAPPKPPAPRAVSALALPTGRTGR